MKFISDTDTVMCYTFPQCLVRTEISSVSPCWDCPAHMSVRERILSQLHSLPHHYRQNLDLALKSLMQSLRGLRLCLPSTQTIMLNIPIYFLSLIL